MCGTIQGRIICSDMMRKSADRRDKGYGTREAKEMLAVIIDINVCSGRLPKSAHSEVGLIRRRQSK